MREIDRWSMERLREEAAITTAGQESSSRLNDMADWIQRVGFATLRMKAVAIHLGVKKCAECGGVAIYRSGTVGACRKHKEILRASVDRRQKRADDRGAAINSRLDEIDSTLRSKDSLKAIDPKRCKRVRK